MSELWICPIVEGHGECEAVRPLLQRTWIEIVGGSYVEVLRPIRQSRGKLLIDQELQRAVQLASSKLSTSAPSEEHKLVLVLVDAEDDKACVLGPQLLAIARGTIPPGISAACVVANTMYETWFVAAAESLAIYLRLTNEDPIPTDPESQRCGKGWVKQRFLRAKYSETVDQPAMTSAMDLQMCRSRSPSFDKLCRELQRFVVSA